MSTTAERRPPAATNRARPPRPPLGPRPPLEPPPSKAARTRTPSMQAAPVEAAPLEATPVAPARAPRQAAQKVARKPAKEAAGKPVARSAAKTSPPAPPRAPGPVLAKAPGPAPRRLPPPPPPAPRATAVVPEPTAPKVVVRAARGLLGARRPNRRITVENRSILLWLSEAIAAVARRLLTAVKVLGAVAALAGAVWAGRLAVQHIVASSRFALREIRVAPTAHLGRSQIVALSGVAPGDRLLALDTDQIAARLARHPWIAGARVQRELPTTLVVEVSERRAEAVATLGALYLIDENGHAFKQATVDEAEGLVVLTGLTREQYAGRRDASESAFREALTVLGTYRQRDPGVSGPAGSRGDAAREPHAGGLRPALSEIHIDPRNGFSLFLYDGGAEVRLGRERIADKLSRLDQILLALGPGGATAARVIHLDGPAEDRIPIRLADPVEPPAGPAGSASGASNGATGASALRQASGREVKKSTPARNPVISGKRPLKPLPSTPVSAAAETGPDTD